MAAEERDTTADWIVPAERRPPSAFELQRRIEVATGIARAAEEAAMEIGQASLEAAEQARLAAAHAERSAEASVAVARALAGRGEAATAPDTASPRRVAPSPVRDDAPAVRGAAFSTVDDSRSAPEAARPRSSAAPYGHEEIPGSELPAGWSPVAESPPAQIPLPAATAASASRPSAQPDAFDERMIAFRERAERVMARLARLEAAPPVS